MRAFVLDASVALAWVVDNPVPPYAVKISEVMASGKKAVVPGLWALEMANGLLMAERRGKLTAAEVDHGLRQLEVVEFACGCGEGRNTGDVAYFWRNWHRLDGAGI